MKFRTIVFVTVVLMFAGIARAQELPEPVGFVNDFAQKLTPQEHQQLEGIVQDFKNKTGIEFAVVTEESLNGKPEFERSLEFARGWHVGEKETGNGLLLYIAFKEHKYFMQISRHLEDDLTDGRAGQIQREHLVPHFKRGEYAEGITETVNAVIAKLGDATIAEREVRKQERELQEQQRREEQERQSAEWWRQFKTFLGYTLPIGFILGSLTLAFFVIRRRRQALKELQRDITNALQQIEDCLSKARGNEASVIECMSALKLLAPMYDWRKLDERVQEQSTNIATLEKNLTTLRGKSLNKYEDAKIVLTWVKSLLIKSSEALFLLSDINGKILSVEKARDESASLIVTLRERIAKVCADLCLPNVPESAKERVQVAKTQYKKAKQLARREPVDWITVRDTLRKVESLLAHSESMIRESQQPKPSSHRSSRSSGSSSGGSFSSSSDNGSHSDYNSNSRESDWSSGSSSSSNDSGGGFGGGGDFGGGGAGGSW